jgi:flagellar motor protein MotB
MLEDSGVPKERLVVVSFGENQPVATNENPEGRAQNRRIEIRIRPVAIEN